MLLIALGIVAIIGAASEKLWLLMLVIICMAVWIFVLLTKQEHLETLLKTTRTAFTDACSELTRSQSRRIRRSDSLGRHVD